MTVKVICDTFSNLYKYLHFTEKQEDYLGHFTCAFFCYYKDTKFRRYIARRVVIINSVNKEQDEQNNKF